jgi:release factor glutamine methyltransferase
MPLTINEFYRNLTRRLKEVYPAEEAHAMADRLIEHYFGFRPAARVIHGSEPVEVGMLNGIENAVGALLRQEPLQYVLGYAWFMDMKFAVSPAVLIPRPETEELADRIIQYSLNLPTDHPVRILDIGTGSGCIAVALARSIPGAVVTAADISESALQMARQNAIDLNARVHFVKMDVLQPDQWDMLPEFDLIVSNPPYVTLSEMERMQPNVLEYEPHSALFVPDEDPLIFYRAIAALASQKLAPGGTLWFEINEQFGELTRKMVQGQGFGNVIIFSDFQKKDRFLQASFEFSC